MQSYRYIQEIGTICVKDTYLDIQLTIAQGLQSRGLESSLTVRSLIDDRQVENKQYNKHRKQNGKQRRKHMIIQWLGRLCCYDNITGT
jgi:hypothetical protein